MNVNIELRVDIEDSSWCMRIDGHEWETGLTTAVA